MHHLACTATKRAVQVPVEILEEGGSPIPADHGTVWADKDEEHTLLRCFAAIRRTWTSNGLRCPCGDDPLLSWFSLAWWDGVVDKHVTRRGGLVS